MENPAAAGEAMRAAIEYWCQFVARCVSERLETDKFEAYVKIVHEQHPLPPALVADFFLRPQPSDDSSLDPRIPPYLQVLTKLGYVDTPSILNALYKYSSSHAHAQAQKQHLQSNTEEGKGKEKGNGDDKEKDEEKENTQPKKSITRWKSSYWAEEVLFYRLTKSVVEGRAIQDSRTALEVAMIISKFMELFTTALPATAFAADMLEQQFPSGQLRDDMESSRAALVALLLRLCENNILVSAISKPFAKSIASEHLSLAINCAD
jgi:mediator of RNA polymerase II transcription subunit 5